VRPLRVAAAQAASRAGDIAANCRTAAELVPEAARRGASLVVFPELFLCGYDLERIRSDPDACDLRPADSRLDALRTQCRASRVHVVVGASIAEPDGRRLAALIIDARGAIRGRYAKRHLWGPERELFAPGDRPCSIHLGGWRLELAICVEASRPEHAHAAARHGAMAYLTLSADERVDPLLHSTRARENGMYVVNSNHVGDGFCGRTAIYGPTGACLAQLDGHERGLAVAQLDQTAIARARRSPAPGRVDIDLSQEGA
jgi:predicted amidohydrolase